MEWAHRIASDLASARFAARTRLTKGRGIWCLPGSPHHEGGVHCIVRAFVARCASLGDDPLSGGAI